MWASRNCHMFICNTPQLTSGAGCSPHGHIVVLQDTLEATVTYDCGYVGYPCTLLPSGANAAGTSVLQISAMHSVSSLGAQVQR
jgi:hypothetical protein